jgi:Kef-type K+ transport system membrane component KefB
VAAGAAGREEAGFVEKITLVNLFAVMLIAFLVPFALGFLPRLRVPAVVLELVAGIIFGPAVLGWIKPGPVVQIVSNLGVAFLLFLAGMELDLRQLRGAPLRLGSIGFVISLALGFAIMLPLGAMGLVLSPLLVATALSATSVGIVFPVLRDTGMIESPAGRFIVAGGAAAEFGTIAVLGVFFAGANANAWVEALLLGVVGIVAVLALFGLSRLWKWEPGRVVSKRLDETSSQVRVRFAVVVLLGAAVLASSFGFESILGTFLAGALLAVVIRGDQHEHAFRGKIEAVGFGFFVPVFFVTSGLRFDLSGFGLAEAGRAAFFLVVLLLVRGLPALLYKRHLSWRETAAAGLLQATNLSFIVVAVTVGVALGKMLQVNASALIIAGLLSAVLFPWIAQALLGGAGKTAPVADEDLSVPFERIVAEEPGEAL